MSNGITHHQPLISVFLQGQENQRIYGLTALVTPSSDFPGILLHRELDKLQVTL